MSRASGVSVGRRIGGAVQRNKVKRAIRESFWKLAAELPAGHDYVIVARPGVEGLVDRDGSGGVLESLAELVGPGDGTRRAGSVCRETVADGAAAGPDPRLPALDLAWPAAPLPL